MVFRRPLRLTALMLAFMACATSAQAAEKRVYRVDSVTAKLEGNGRVVLTAKGAVSTGGWKKARLRVLRRDGRTLTVEFLASPPPPGAAVITALVPVTASSSIRLRRGVVSVRAMAEANEVTAQILH